MSFRPGVYSRAGHLPAVRFALDDLALLASTLDCYWCDRDERRRGACRSTTHLARRVGVDPRTVLRWRRDGLPLVSADRAAIALGFHPAEIWPAFLSVEER